MMFCKKCGKEMSEDSKFCNSCGYNQEGEIANIHETKAPNYEFKTVRCYPSDVVENEYKNFYEDCGWQIVDMDRKQVVAGGSKGITKYQTQTHIKMQRDKNRANYAKIKELSEKAEMCFGRKPTKEGWMLKRAALGFMAAAVLPMLMGIIFFLFARLEGAFTESITETSNFGIAVNMFLIAGSLLVAGIFIIIVSTLAFSKKQKEADANFERDKAISNAARAECRKLVHP